MAEEDQSEMKALHGRTLDERSAAQNGRSVKKAIKQEKEEQASINGDDSTADELQQLRAAVAANERALKNKELLNSMLMAKLEQARTEKNEEQRKNAQLNEELRNMRNGFDVLMTDYRQEQKKCAKVTQLYKTEQKISAKLRKKLEEREILTATEELTADRLGNQQLNGEWTGPITSPPVDTIQLGASMRDQLLTEQRDFELPLEMDEQGKESTAGTGTLVSVPTGGVFKCRTCPDDHVAYSTAEQLAKHQHLAHGDRQHCRHQCPECGWRCLTNVHLQRHMRTHSGEKPYQCRWCGRGFAEKGNLTRHERVHTGERPYVCTVCQKTFKQRTDLVAHGRLHSGETPYSCRHCAKQFNYLSGCHKHEKICAKRGLGHESE